MKKWAAVLIMIFFLTGCSASTVTTTSGNPTAADVLELEPSADIFQLDGVIYQANVEWVDQLSLTKGEKAGEIKQKINVGKDFQDGSATHLSKGTFIFKAVENNTVLIVDVTGKEQYYLALLEG